MSTYNCIILDDNLIERKAVAVLVRDLPGIEIVAMCQNALEALDVLEKNEIDIIFSDIDMPGLSGIDFLKSLKNPPLVIFITSHMDFAAESYELDALDFVLKPVTLPRIIKAVNKAKEYLELRKNAVAQQTPRTANNNTPPDDSEDFFYIKETKGLTRIRYDEVIYAESMGDFTKIFTTHDKHFVVLSNLKNFENQLSPRFFKRVHRQYLVNTQYIVTIGVSELTMRHGHEIPISHSYRQELLSQEVNGKVINRFAS